MLVTLAIHCMITLSTTDTIPAWGHDLHFVSLDPDKVLYPDYTEPFLVYPIHRFTQKIRKEQDRTFDNHSRRGIWKHFENYKLVSGVSSIPVTIWNKQRGHPPAHVYAATVPSAYALYWQWSPSGGPVEPFGEAGKLNLGLPPFYLEQETGRFVTPPSTLGSLYTTAMQNIIPAIKSDLSLINSVIELKDFKSLPRMLVQLKSAIPLIRKFFTYYDASRPARELSKTSAGAFLQWKFAIAPLLSDLAAIRAAISSYERKITSLVARTGGKQTRHFTWRWNEFDDVDETSSGGFPQPWLGQNGCVLYDCRRKVRYRPSEFHAEVEFNYNYTQYQQQHAVVLGLLDALGVNFNPAIIWNALPWSFVVDWFVKVANQLEQFKIRNLEPQINIHQFLWSIKRVRTIECDVGPSPAVTELEGTLDRSRTSLPVVREEAYGRFLDHPIASSIELSGLSSMEFTLGAAIVIAQGRRRKRR